MFFLDFICRFVVFVNNLSLLYNLSFYYFHFFCLIFLLFLFLCFLFLVLLSATISKSLFL